MFFAFRLFYHCSMPYELQNTCVCLNCFFGTHYFVVSLNCFRTVLYVLYVDQAKMFMPTDVLLCHGPSNLLLYCGKNCGLLMWRYLLPWCSALVFFVLFVGQDMLHFCVFVTLAVYIEYVVTQHEEHCQLTLCIWECLRINHSYSGTFESCQEVVSEIIG